MVHWNRNMLPTVY